MKVFEWSSEKNRWLKEKRGISFEEVELAFMDDRVLDELSHPNQEKFSHQRIIVIELDGYAYVVPYVECEEGYYLKTMYPSRSMTKLYLRQYDEK